MIGDVGRWGSVLREVAEEGNVFVRDMRLPEFHWALVSIAQFADRHCVPNARVFAAIVAAFETDCDRRISASLDRQPSYDYRRAWQEVAVELPALERWVAMRRKVDEGGPDLVGRILLVVGVFALGITMFIKS